ncbi:endonuclease [Capnocytophaga catalasegens]|uniref:Endonuclease n=2 Tax=Capnocytophaga catalasegens TaxID=1004260 RepID=A0AAV5AUJ5_9FLAO|nr:endonuclease [Capnocytophaga catalasegens]GJM50199.1 endonuclease [Capnocytophaga catalasegens]GJM52038.1 endonuclease [Capnocytophaga catalasegens]
MVLWIVKSKKVWLFSGVLFVLGIPFLNRFIQFSGENNPQDTDIKLMSFNARVFNYYNWHTDTTLHTKIVDFIDQEHPNIIAIQEFYRKESNSFDFYKYKKIIYKNAKDNIGQAILSDYPIIHSGSLNFPHTKNNGIFADILIEKDTLRLYSLHFESFHINPEEQELSQEGSKRLLLNLGKRFALQQSQVELLEAHYKACPYKIILCGDFNNTAFSYLYRRIKSGGLQDSFVVCGKGFGQTFNFSYFPLRIDYIFTDPVLQLSSFKTFSDIKYSDHYPILATFRFAE